MLIVKFSNTTPLPLMIILIVKFSNTTPLPLTILWGGSKNLNWQQLGGSKN